jgi:phosphatidylethanolamine/phosphatidyl-N-methylethanolamine N-methyltransferase
MTSAITADLAPIVELGPGTGVVTRELLARGIPEWDLTLVERDTAFASMLTKRFPRASVVYGEAQALRERDLAWEVKPGAFVCGLPLLSMPAGEVTEILRFAFEHMRPGGNFYQLTYMPYCPVPRRILDPLGLKAKRFGGTWANVPPASVYRLSPRVQRIQETETG